MEQAPSFAQLLKQAIDNRLLDVHTALVGRIERYDEKAQLVDVQPLLKRQIKDQHGGIREEELPLLVDVPVLFPRGGAFFVSLPIQVGDVVQVIVNEQSIDDLFTESSALSFTGRFSLQGAVAVPGMFMQSKPLRSAHKTNLTLGLDEGVQLHVDREKIRLGSEKADEALAIAKSVEAELTKIITAFNSHIHLGGCPAGQVTLSPPSAIDPVGDLATKKVVAE